jgi:hypothetical protein
MGSRTPLGLRNYFASLEQGFANVKAALAPGAYVVQLVAFSDTETQLPRYLDVMARAGYKELQLPRLAAGGNNVRTVPNRKWYAYGQGKSDASKEVLLVHMIRD